jgi:hypothetical protein
MNFTQKLCTFFFLFFFTKVSAQQIGINTTTPHASATLDIADTARGILIPRLTALQRDSIYQPAEGLMVYQTDSIRGFWYFSQNKWNHLIEQNNEPINREIKRLQTQLYIKP